jgi:tellurite resistance protein
MSLSAAAAPVPATSIKNLQINLFASVMGLSGLALAWRSAGSAFNAPAAIGDAIGAFAVLVFAALAIGYLVKWQRFPEAVKQEFTHPVSSNFFGTVTIGMLLLSSVVGAWSPSLRVFLWTIASIATLVLAVVIVSRMLNGRVPLANVVPAWLIPGVATLDIAVAGGTLHMPWAHELNLLGAGVGAMLAVVFLVMIISRLVQGEPLPLPMTPSLMILIGPFAVGFLAYVNLTGRVDSFAALLFYFALFLFVVLAGRVFRPSVAFAPGWWAISFPLAALANAALAYAMVSDSLLLAGVAIALLAFLTAALAVLTVRTLHWLWTGRLLSP